MKRNLKEFTVNFSKSLKISSILKSISGKSDFAKDAITLTIGTSIAQFVPILFYPILTRVFTPAEFGLLATLTSITSILVVISTGKYENSILIADSKVDAANIITLVFLLSIVLLTISSVILQIFSFKLGQYVNEPSLQKWIIICPISALFIIIYNCYNEWCVRNKYFNILAINKIVNSAATTFSKLLFGILRVINNGLVIGDLLGRFISAMGCIYRGWKRDKSTFLQITYPKMQYLLKKYIDFPRLILPGQLLNIIGGSIPVFLIGAYFNKSEVGYYAISMNVLGIPISVISRAIQDVFRQRANEEFITYGRCDKILLRILKILIIWIVIGVGLLFFIIPEIFSFVLGESWRIAGEYSQILLPMMAIDFIAVSLSGVFIITNKLSIELFWQIYYVGISIISFIIGYLLFHDIKSCLIFFSTGRATAYFLEIFLSFKYSKGVK